MKKADLHEKIEDYIKGRLPNHEREAFMHDVKNDKELQEEVSLHQDLITATGEKDIIELRQQMKSYFDPPSDAGHSAQDSTVPEKKFKTWWLLGLLPILVLLWLFVGRNQSVQPAAIPTPSQEQETTVPPLPPNIPIASDAEKAAEQDASSSSPQQESLIAEENTQDHSSPPIVEASNEEYLALATTNFAAPGNVLIRSGEDAEKSKIELAQLAYNEGLNTSEAAKRKAYFLDCLSLLEEAETAPGNTIQYLRAHAYFQLGEYEKAAAEFKSLLDDFEYGYNADWGHLLSLIAQGADQKASYTTALEKLTNSTSHSFHQKALELQTQLKQIEQ